MDPNAGAPNDPELVGLAEVSGLLGVPASTVASWRQRKLLPEPRWRLLAGPVWLASDIREWYEREKGGRGAAVVPDRLREAIDLSAEPHRAEVFAHYGLAMGEAQMVEQHLADVIALLHPPAATSRMFFEIVERAERKTLGALKQELRTFGVPVIGLELLGRIVDLRNLLAHRYFRDPERSVKMTTERGREELIAELDSAARELWTTAQYLRAAEVLLAIQRGASESGVMERVRHIRAGNEPTTVVGQRKRRLVEDSPEADKLIEDAFASAEVIPDFELTDESVTGRHIRRNRRRPTR